MDSQSSEALHSALSRTIRDGVKKYGPSLLLSFSDRNRDGEQSDDLENWRSDELTAAIGVSILALITSGCIAAIAIYGGVW